MQEKIRLLAAIMFTDMVGFTALMQKDESKANSLKDRHKQVLEYYIPKYQGKILQYYGDGTLSIFSSAIQAVNCAIEIQKELTKEPEIPLRIGLHLGDVVYNEEGVYGDAVNVASRIESLSVPGAVLISDKLRNEIINHPLLSVKSLGKFELKNVKVPVEVFAMTSEGLIIPKPEEMQGKGNNAFRSVAVLPFINMSADIENEYFSDGMTEEIINALTKVEGLQVTSRTSSFTFKGKNEDVRMIGQKLNVSTILEGSVRKSGNMVRITAQLINSIDGYHFWSENYDGTLDDIFKLQDDISRKIANKLIEQIPIDQCNCNVSKVTAPLVKKATTDLEAYNLYLKGMYYWNKWSHHNANKAIRYLEEAIKTEPQFDKAYALLANCYVYLGAMGALKSDIAYPKAKEYSAKALQIDALSPDSNVATGVVKLFVDWDWEGSRIAFEKAIELSPSNALAYFTYAMYLVSAGRFKDSIAAMEKAVLLDPLSLPINENLGTYYANAGRLDDALKQFNKTLEIDPTFRLAAESKGWTYYFMGDTYNSMAVFQELHRS